MGLKEECELGNDPPPVCESGISDGPACVRSRSAVGCKRHHTISNMVPEELHVLCLLVWQAREGDGS